MYTMVLKAGKLLYGNLEASQRDAMGYHQDEHISILRDGVQVASWEPGTGWRYWRSEQDINQWFCDASTSQYRHAMLANLRGKSGDDGVNAYLDSIGALLPDGCLPPGLPQVDKPLRTPSDIAAWCLKHFENQDVRKAIVAAKPRSHSHGTLGGECEIRDGWYPNIFRADVEDGIVFNLVRDLPHYPDLHRELSRIIDEYVEPAPPTFGWTPMTVVEWDFREPSSSVLWNAFDHHIRSKHNALMYGFRDETYFNEHPDVFHAACAWLEEHGVKAPAQHGIQIRKEGSAMAQRSPIFGIKLACGSQIGFQKTENGDVIILTSGPQLNGQIISNEDRHKLDTAGAKAATWKPEAQLSEWKFE